MTPPAQVPPALLEFQSTLRMPRVGSPVELFRSFDGYTNGEAPEVAKVAPAVPIEESGGWRLTADVYVPFGEPPFPVLVYFHGGGWVMGSPWTHRRVTAELAARGLLVASVDYRRAPKYRFPGAVDDAAVALDWARGHAAEFGGDLDRLIVGGDSAGANLAATTLVAGAADVRAALLCYGIYDFHRALPILAGLLGGEAADEQRYLPADEFETLRGDPRVSPEHAAAGFPPTLLTVGEHDPLLGESQVMAARLADAGIPHELHVAAGAPHGYLQLPTLAAHDEGLSVVTRFLGRHGILGTS
jgi:acetyl esterase